MRKVYLVVAILLLSLIAVSAFAQGIQNVELHGYIQNRFYANPSTPAEVAVQRVSLSAVGKLGTDGQVYVEVYYQPWGPDYVVSSAGSPPLATNVGAITADEFRTYLESAYVDLPFAGGRIRIGKGRQLNFGLTPSYPNRKTTQYGILAETFTQDRIQGIQDRCQQGYFSIGERPCYADQSVGTGFNSRFIGEFPGFGPDNVVAHVADRDIPGEISDRLAVSSRVGISTPCFQIHVSGATGGMDQSDLAQFNAAATAITPFGFGTPNNTNTDHNKYGVDSIYSSGPFVAQGEWYQGHFSFLGITGYSILAGYQPAGKQRAYVRWDALNNDQPATADNQLSWNTQQLTFAFIQPIRKGVWAELEYEKNMESPPAGVASVKNDLLFVEFFSGF